MPLRSCGGLINEVHLQDALLLACSRRKRDCHACISGPDAKLCNLPTDLTHHKGSVVTLGMDGRSKTSLKPLDGTLRAM